MNVRHPQGLSYLFSIKNIYDNMDLRLFLFYCDGMCLEIRVRRLKSIKFLLRGLGVCIHNIDERLTHAAMGGKIDGLKATSILKTN